jgi:hypothetical protein
MEKAIYEKTSNGNNAAKIIEIYAKKLEIETQGFQRIVDKQLYNFRYTGVILSHLPSSKIIHTRRNPLDNLLSIYRAGLPTFYTSNLEETARIIILQEAAMAEYKKQWPSNIYTLKYENLVDSTRNTLTELISWIGLSWDENYLYSEKNKGPISTASLYQARKPINKSSVNGWKNYASMLEQARVLIKKSGLFEDYNLQKYNH